MIGLEDAKRIAIGHLANLSDSGGTELEIAKVQEESFGWVFFYQAREYLERGMLSSMLAGNAPFVVLRESGAIKTLGTVHPASFYIDELRKKYGSLSGEGPLP
jgi:hypothetical protein